jgi:hypothetical protein
MLWNRIRNAILKSWVGQNIWYRYIKPPGAYCKCCGRCYTYQQFNLLPKERVHHQYMATRTICECGAHTWAFVG